MNTQFLSGLNKWLALMVVVFGTFMAILDSSIVNIAIPKMMAVFGVSADDIKWVLTAYMLAMGAVIPLTGYFGDRFGTKKVYVWSLALFTIGSALCGFAWSNSSMIAARIIQAIGGGMIMPTSMAIIYQIVKPEERGTALGIWGIAAMAAPAIGPTLSGYILEHLNWRLIFTVNIPVGVVAVVLAIILLPEFPKKQTHKFDLLGFISIAGGLSCVMYVLGEGSAINWNDFTTVFLLIVGIFGLILFVLNELTHDEPLLDLRVLKIWPFSLSIILSSLMMMGMYGGVYLLPLFLQNLQGFTAMQTGMIMFPSAIATAITMPISGKLFDRFGAKPIVIPGLILLAWTTFELAHISIDTSSSTITWVMLIRGFGMGLCMMPATTAGMNHVPPALVGRASALSNVIRQVAGSLSITIITTIMQTRQVINYARLTEQVTWFNTNSLDLIKGLQGLYMKAGLSASISQASALNTLNGIIQRQSLAQAIDDTLFVTFIIAFATIFLGFLIQKKKVVTGVSNSENHVIME